MKKQGTCDKKEKICSPTRLIFRFKCWNNLSRHPQAIHQCTKTTTRFNIAQRLDELPHPAPRLVKILIATFTIPRDP